MKLLLVLMAAAGLQLVEPSIPTGGFTPSAAEILFDSAPNVLTLPDDIYLGEVGGVAANSKGEM